MLISPVPDFVLMKVWKIPRDDIKFERGKVRDAIDDARMYLK